MVLVTVTAGAAVVMAAAGAAVDEEFIAGVLLFEDTRLARLPSSSESSVVKRLIPLGWLLAQKLV